MDALPHYSSVTLDPPIVTIPVYSGKVSAGQSRFPSPAQDYEQKELDLNQRFIINRPATFFFEVEGDSMVDIGIFPGTILTVNRAITARTNHIVLAVLDGEWMVKRYYKKGDIVRLYSENKSKEYPLIQPKEGQELIVWGVVTSVHTSTL